MNISAAADRTNLPPKTIRYYEDIALIKPEREPNGYRNYSDRDVHILRFLQRARSLGFSITECRNLLSLYEDKSRASAEVKAIATGKIHEIENKMEQLRSLRHVLAQLAEHCRRDERPDCPMIDEISRRNVS